MRNDRITTLHRLLIVLVSLLGACQDASPEPRSAVQIVPGLIGVILTMTMVLFTAVAIVRERERGNLELLINTPVRTPELMAGKILPYIGIGLIQVSLIVWLGVWLFGVPIRGSLLDFYLGSAIFIGASLALGLLISTAAQTQMRAFQMTFFFCYRRSCCLDLCFSLMACRGWRSILPKDCR